MAKKMVPRYTVTLKASVVIRHHGKVLLIRERHNPRHPYRLNIIKGSFEPGKDISIFDAATREAREEANAKIKLKYLLSAYYLLYEQNALMTFTFIADLLNPRHVGVVSKKLQAQYSKTKRINEVKFFSRKELARLKPKDFVGMRGYVAIQDYLKGIRFSLAAVKTLPPK